MDDKYDPIKEKILVAAEEKFGYFGFDKTTMNDIARECEMSPANIYRFFENKEALAVDVGMRYRERLMERIEEVVANDSLSAGEKLRRWVYVNFKFNMENLRERPRMTEMVLRLTSDRNALVDSFLEMHSGYVRGIIASGVAEGEFGGADAKELVNAVISATSKFVSTPALATMARYYSTAELEESCRVTVELILKGLRNDGGNIS